MINKFCRKYILPGLIIIHIYIYMYIFVKCYLTICITQVLGKRNFSLVYDIRRCGASVDILSSTGKTITMLCGDPLRSTIWLLCANIIITGEYILYNLFRPSIWLLCASIITTGEHILYNLFRPTIWLLCASVITTGEHILYNLVRPTIWLLCANIIITG